ncbi:unnamed protein product [Paramecium octaurelia]|uniref:Uncharacterized protein n=1 Tax=Paramecium octaurelia TaxID=43137 RepID=A0A8S1YMZ8_PAROT|nr:unnamed protein product [Paramecium octaurelia]
MIKFSFLLLILRVIQNAESKYELFYSAFIDNNFNNEGWHIENNRSNLIFTICDNQTLFGGYNTFAINTLITYNSSLPPHYKIKISFKFWKIDSWNDEWLYIFIDDQIIQQKFAMREGYPICGVFDADSLEKEVLYEVEMIHTNKFIFNIITSNLDQEGNNESWGIHEFKIEILQCPKGCIYCFDDLSPCDFWINIKSILQTPSQFDEWKREDNTTISSSICAGLNITGGEHILGVNQTVQNIIINFPPHFQAIIEFKLWLFGNWPNDTFILKLDDYQLLEVPLKNQTGPLINCGGTKQNVAFINLRAQTDHSQESMKITFATKSNSSNIKYWGINAFDAYIAKCSNNCQICLGPGQKQCIACIKDWVLFKGDCIYFDKIPPLTCVSTKIIQKVKPISNNINQIQFQSDLMAQKSLKLGENEIEFDQTIPTLNFEIQARCLQNLKIQNSIKIFIRQSDQQQYMFTRGCQDSSPGFIFQINLQQKFEQIKQFILNLSETSVELYQLVILDYQETKILTFSVNFTSI